METQNKKAYTHELSIVIVNYRVPLLLGQCLDAVRVATEHINAEVWVVDNASGDDSMEYLKPRYPWVKFVENSENLGFSRANNIAMQASDSEFILLLNPDTIIAEDTLVRSLEHMRQHPECGGMGVRMHNIQGRYLPESKRGFPGTWASFCKLSGLCKLFPKVKLFSSYYMGHLSSHEVQSVEVLLGAYMLMRSEVLDEVGLLDETFFMYGEDIDLSYRIVKAGHECHYVPLPTIHYKGESSILDSTSYIERFYGAMQIFFDKYYKGRMSQLGRWVIRLAISGVTLVARLKAMLRKAPKGQVRSELIPIEIPLKTLPPVGAHLLIDGRNYTFAQIIDQIIRYPKQQYTYHIINREGEIVSPRR